MVLGPPLSEKIGLAQDRHSLASHDTVDLRRVDSHPDHWYPLAWSDELAAGKTLGRRLMGEPVVLYRGASGNVFALEDRCAHRQVPLSIGVVDGDVLKCGYHGWAYDCSGKCVDVPYFGMEKLPNGVRSYPAREIDGLIFVFPGDPALADAAAPASLGSTMNRDYKTRKLNREVDCHYTFMHENLFDMNHQFLHRKNMGTIKAKCLGKRSGDNWCEVDYTFDRTGGRASMGETVIVDLVRSRGGKQKNLNDLMTIRTEYPYQRLKVWVGKKVGGDLEPVLDVWLAYTPLDKEQRTNRTFGYLSVKKPPVPGLIHVFWPFVTWFTERIFTEDKVIVQLEQAAHDAQGTDWNNEVFPPIRDLRALLARQGRPLDDGARSVAAE